MARFPHLRALRPSRRGRFVLFLPVLILAVVAACGDGVVEPYNRRSRRLRRANRAARAVSAPVSFTWKQVWRLDLRAGGDRRSRAARAGRTSQRISSDTEAGGDDGRAAPRSSGPWRLSPRTAAASRPGSGFSEVARVFGPAIRQLPWRGR
jgi:hypothetical protein